MFRQKPVAAIKAKITGTDDVLTVAGTNPTETSETNAKTQIDKILALVGDKTVSIDAMTQVITKEVVDDE